MKESLIGVLRCPSCHRERSFSLEVDERDELEVRAGELRCGGCGHIARVDRGIADLLHEPPSFVARESAGLQRFVTEAMIPDGWDRARILNLPYEQSGYWFVQATIMNQTLEETSWKPGARVLDVGSNTCWAAALLAEQGFDVVALDITPIEYQGLGTAEWWMQAKGLYMERVLGVMFDLPFADETFDHIWCSEVLHHNDRANLARTFRELHRVLKPNGEVIVNEPLRCLRDLNLHPGKDVAQFDGHEHAYTRWTFTRLARKAGFDVEARPPRLHAAFQRGPITFDDSMPLRTLYKGATALALRRRPRLQKAYLAWLTYVRGTLLHMVCTKTGREDALTQPSKSIDEPVTSGP